MYCSIRNFNEYDYNGNISNIKEFIYPYNATDIVEKLELTKDQTKYFVFQYNGDFSEDISDLNDLFEVRKNVKLMIDSAAEVPKDLKIPYFYSMFHMDADSLDKLRTLCEIGVSDVYIAGELGFNMQEARTIADRFEVKLRVAPNITTISGFGGSLRTEGLTSFWIRPNDLDLYEDYIDVVEFSCLDEKQEVFYNVYFQEKEWRGNLNVLIYGLFDLENVGLIPAFTENRLNCKKKCLLDRCHKCDRFAIAAKTIVENDLEIELEESI